MTKEEILAMEAGRELDELVVTEVLNQSRPDFFPSQSLELTLTGSPFHRNGWTCIHRYENLDKPEWVSDPVSTDISAAFQVLEAMRNMKDEQDNLLICCLTIRSDYNYVWNIGWDYSELSSYDDGHKEHHLPCSFEELPEAICKAALCIKRKSDE